MISKKLSLSQLIEITIWSGLGIGAFIAAAWLGYAVYQIFTALGVPGFILLSVGGFIIFTVIGSFYLRWFTD